MSDVFERIVEAAGGQDRLAAKLGITRQAVNQWQLRGIPPARYMQVAHAAGIPMWDLWPHLYDPPPQQEAAT